MENDESKTKTFVAKKVNEGKFSRRTFNSGDTGLEQVEVGGRERGITSELPDFSFFGLFVRVLLSRGDANEGNDDEFGEHFRFDKT